MSSTRDAVIEFVKVYAGRRASPTDAKDLFESYDIVGDDAVDFMHEFASRFGVNMDAYRWYFHHDEEGGNWGAVFFPPPNARVERIPITLKILLEAAETKSWPLTYPPHELPKRRWDLRLNQVFGLFLFSIMGVLLWKCGGQ